MMKNTIQPLAYIHPDAKIGKNVTIEPFSCIYQDVEIGDNTWIGPHVTIMDGGRIGSNCTIFPGAVISAIPQDLKFEGEDSLAVIGDNCKIRESVTVNRGTKALGKTEVKSNVLLMAYVHIAHDCIIGNNCILANSVQVAGHVEVEDYAIVGGSSAVHQFVRIGQHSMISGGSLVRQDVPPFIKSAREPLSFISLNSIGLRRRGFSEENISEIQEIYRYLYQKGMNTTKALEAIENDLPATNTRNDILSFVRQSERGIIRG